MNAAACRKILRSEGFQRLGMLRQDVPVHLWWRPGDCLELSVFPCGGCLLIRANKCFRLTAVGPGEVYLRHLGSFHDYLAAHFPEFSLTCSFVSSITPSLAAQSARSRQFSQGGADAGQLAARLEELSRHYAVAQDSLRRTEELHRLDRGRSELLKRHLCDQAADQRRQLEELRSQAAPLRQQVQAARQIEQELLHHGQGTCYLFTMSSSIHAIADETSFADAVRAVAKELHDRGRYEIAQKLNGNQLQIHVEEIASPAMSLQTRWTGAALDPRQLEKLGPEYAALREVSNRQFEVFCASDLMVAGQVREQKKLVGARIIRDLLGRLQAASPAPGSGPTIPPGPMPIWLGNRAGPNGISEPCEFPLSKMGHVVVCAGTGAGKSVLLRVAVEGIYAHQDVGIVMLDPRNQTVGLLCPENRPEILAQYAAFGLQANDARGLNFTYSCPGLAIGASLPADLRLLARGRHILSCKNLDDCQRCNLAAEVLEALFAACSQRETSLPRTIVVIDELQLFLRSTVEPAAHDAAVRFERALDRISREGRKYGCFAWCSTHGHASLAHGAASLRANATTHIFMRSGDRQAQFAAEFLEDSAQLLRLPTGHAFLCNAEWGTVRIAVRPPLSLVQEPDWDTVRQIAADSARPSPGTAATTPTIALSPTASQVLGLAQELYARAGTAARLASITERLGITSRRQIAALIDELTTTKAARFEHLHERGQPLVVVPLVSGAARINPEHQCGQNGAEIETRTQSGQGNCPTDKKLRDGRFRPETPEGDLK